MSPEQTGHDPRDAFGERIPPIDPCFDSRFRQLTESGNLAFSGGDAARAAALYEDALDEAEHLFARAERDGGSASILLGPMLLNIACHNLAAAKSRTGHEGEALALASRAAERLIETAASAARPIALRINCVRHLGHALHFLSEFGPHHDGSERETIRLVRLRASEVAAEVKRVATFWLATTTEGKPEPQWGRATRS